MQIVFFDGVCVLCSRFVQFLLRHDAKHVLHFSSLQGDAIKKTKAVSFVKENTIILCKENEVYIRSKAAIECIAALGGIWKVVRVFLLIPGFIRDPLYNVIATHRYRFFGKNPSCFIPKQEQKKHFLE
jgi:predicted DCC family thiol-disulfide oxidoreductase YuxK